MKEKSRLKEWKKYTEYARAMNDESNKLTGKKGIQLFYPYTWNGKQKSFFYIITDIFIS